MGKIIFLILVGLGAWWYQVGGRQLSDEQVRAFYQQQEAAFVGRLPEKLCDALDDQFYVERQISSSDQSFLKNTNKSQICEEYKEMYKNIDALEKRNGVKLPIEYSYLIYKVEIAPDKKSAVVDIWYALDVANSLINIRSRLTETLIRKNGKVKVVRSDGTMVYGRPDSKR
jgi:hypothetical protein